MRLLESLLNVAIVNEVVVLNYLVKQAVNAYITY